MAFLDRTQPENISDVMKPTVLCRLLDSYCFPLGAGLTVYYPKVFPVATDSITEVESAGVAARQIFSPFCREYRGLSPMCEKACKCWDWGIVLKYYTGDWEGPRLYRCHLGLWDMVFPLCVGERLLGVLFGGQIVVAEQVGDWCQAIQSVATETEFQPLTEASIDRLPVTYDQVADICAAIDARPELTALQKTRLKDLAHDEAMRQGLGTNALLKRYREFKEFGKALVDVVEDFGRSEGERASAEHVHECSKEISVRGDQLAEDAGRFWATLDAVIHRTLPSAKGYVLYRHDRNRGGYEPSRTCVYDKQTILDGAGFRSVCRWVFERLRSTSPPRDYVVYDLSQEESRPSGLYELFREALNDEKRVAGGAVVVGFPLMRGGGGMMGALICVCASAEVCQPWQPAFSEAFLRPYVESLASIASILAMVFARHDAEEAQAAAWAVRSHELVAPIHAVKGYQDNLKYYFRGYIEPLLMGENNEIKAVFEARLARLEGLCDLQELIATSLSLEEEAIEGAQLTNLANEVLVPLVQPLRDFATDEKNVTVYFEEGIRKVPDLYVLVNAIKRCIFNLLFNAIKYSDNNSAIRLFAKIMRNDYEIHITNSGIGVPEGEEDRIFKRFVQGSNSGRRVAYGAGLGLYVARRIARLHGGDVRLVSGKPENTVFALCLPVLLQTKRPGELGKELRP